MSKAIGRYGDLRCPLGLICFLLSFACFIFFVNKNQNQTTISNCLEWPERAIPTDDERNKTFEIRFKNIHIEYRMDFTDPCRSSTKLLMLSMTRRDGFEKRQGIRQTWMADAYHTEMIRFLISDPAETSENVTISKLLEEEQAKHGDLVFIHGFTDSYQHIHLKWYAALQWQQEYCPKVEWVAKTDDDSIVHLRRLDFWMGHKLRKIPVEHPLFIMGYVLYNDGPNRNKNKKWFVSEDEYTKDKYPLYVHGPVYLTNPATIAALLAQAPNCAGFHMDDVVFTGILAEMANVTRLNMRQHFTWHDHYDHKHPICEYGVPTAISMWGMNRIDDFEKHYKRLISNECGRNNEE